MDGGAQMEEEEEELATPNAGGNHNGMSTDDYEEIDYKICGELGKKKWLLMKVYRGKEQSVRRVRIITDARGCDTGEDSAARAVQGACQYTQEGSVYLGEGLYQPG